MICHWSHRILAVFPRQRRLTTRVLFASSVHKQSKSSRRPFRVCDFLFYSRLNPPLASAFTYKHTVAKSTRVKEAEGPFADATSYFPVDQTSPLLNRYNTVTNTSTVCALDPHAPFVSPAHATRQTILFLSYSTDSIIRITDQQP